MAVATSIPQPKYCTPHQQTILKPNSSCSTGINNVCDQPETCSFSSRKTTVALLFPPANTAYDGFSIRVPRNRRARRLPTHPPRQHSRACSAWSPSAIGLDLPYNFLHPPHNRRRLRHCRCEEAIRYQLHRVECDIGVDWHPPAIVGHDGPVEEDVSILPSGGGRQLGG